jgi:hypothetical protein
VGPTNLQGELKEGELEVLATAVCLIGSGYPLTISAESGIRICLRVSALLLVDAGEGDFLFYKKREKKKNWPPSA